MSVHLERLVLHSEPYAPTGNIGDSGFKKLLGTPSIDILQTVIREAVQNSCDAANSKYGPEVQIRIRTLTRSQQDVLRDVVLSDLPECQDSREPLERFLTSESPRVLEICDFKTSGLGGPTRADRLPDGTISTDFIDFLRNVGTSRDTTLGAGTYGFGKVSFYLAGSCSTILVDTMTDVENGSQRRLMGCHLGSAHSRIMPDKTQYRYTGRHWWGCKPDDSGVVDPIIGDSASKTAEAIGLPLRQPDRSGTSILVLDPFIGDEQAFIAAKRLVEGILWNFWPRMMQSTKRNMKICFQVVAEDVELDIPAPEDYPPLHLFCKAMDDVRSGANNAELISSKSPKKDLGHISINKSLFAKRNPLVDTGSIIPPRVNHVALMRPAELVVKYLEGAPLPDPRTEWAGVFVASCDSEVEKAFADSEPPAHDDWQPQILPKGPSKTWVNVALREIRRISKEVSSPRLTDLNTGHGDVNLASVSSRLGNHLISVIRKNARRKASKYRHKSAESKRRISKAEHISLDIVDGVRVATFSADLSGSGYGNLIVSEPQLSVEGGLILFDHLDPERQPRTLSIKLLQSELEAEGDTLNVGDATGKVMVVVSVPDDCVVGLKLKIMDVQH